MQPCNVAERYLYKDNINCNNNYATEDTDKKGI